MKAKTTSIFVLATAALGLATAAWAKTYTLQSTPVDPSASGKVEAKTAKGQNTEVTVKVDHLAQPGVLKPPADNYVVWVEPNGGTPHNMGMLKVGSDEKAELKMTTTSPRFSVVITAENQPHPQSPSHRVVMRTEVAE